MKLGKRKEALMTVWRNADGQTYVPRTTYSTPPHSHHLSHVTTTTYCIRQLGSTLKPQQPNSYIIQPREVSIKCIIVLLSFNYYMLTFLTKTFTLSLLIFISIIYSLSRIYCIIFKQTYNMQ